MLFLFLFYIYIFAVWVFCLHVCTYMQHVCAGPTGVRTTSNPLEPELSCESREVNPGPLQEQQVCLTAEPSLQPQHSMALKYVCNTHSPYIRQLSTDPPAHFTRVRRTALGPLASTEAPSEFLRNIGCFWRKAKLLLFLNCKLFELGPVMFLTLNARTEKIITKLPKK